MDRIDSQLRRHRRTVQEIKQLLQEYRFSGLGISAFCKQHRVTTTSFHKWERLFKTTSNIKGTSGFARLDVIVPSASSLFAEVKGIKIYQPVSAGFLKELLS